MNWKAVLVGGLVGCGLSAIGSLVIGLVGITLSRIALVSWGSTFIGAMIAGIMSQSGAWKNGVGAGIFMVIIVQSINYLSGFPPDVPCPIAFIMGALTAAVIFGAIGGFVGGKIKKST